MTLHRKRVVVGVGGGIAAFKAVELVRELTRRGAEVRVVMTHAGTKFVGPITFSGITGKPAVTDLWAKDYAGEVHVELGEWADAVVIAPATMNLLGRLANGLADDVVLATLACTDSPVFVAPAMHHKMWGQAATQRNIADLRARGVHIVGPVVGPLASGEVGAGRMAEPTEIVDAVATALSVSADLQGVQLMVSAGPTYEDLDPVRYLGNRSTGKMGFALAERAAARGATVTLVSGPTPLDDPAGVTVVRVRSARDMHAAITARSDSMDAVIMAAAVADYRPASCAPNKIKKGEDLEVTLVRNPDILADLGKRRSSDRPILVGFALETENVEQAGRDKLIRKGADLVVANHANAGFAGDTNEVVLIDAQQAVAFPTMTKRAVADAVLDRVRGLLKGALRQDESSIPADDPTPPNP